jgi:Helix-turn-helix domain
MATRGDGAVAASTWSSDDGRPSRFIASRHLTLSRARQRLGRSAGIPKNGLMSYPSQPVPEVLRQLRGTATVRQTAAQRRRLIEFVTAEYQGSRSLRELAEQTGRTQTAVRRARDEAGVARRGRGAQPVKST